MRADAVRICNGWNYASKVEWVIGGSSLFVRRTPSESWLGQLINLDCARLRRTLQNGTNIHVVGARHSRSWLSEIVRWAFGADLPLDAGETPCFCRGATAVRGSLLVRDSR